MCKKLICVTRMSGTYRWGFVDDVKQAVPTAETRCVCVCVCDVWRCVAVLGSMAESTDEFLKLASESAAIFSQSSSKSSIDAAVELQQVLRTTLQTCKLCCLNFSLGL